MTRGKSTRSSGIWAVTVGSLAGLTAGFIAGRRTRPAPWVRGEPLRGDAAVEEAVVNRLLRDPHIRNRPIDVAVLAPGILELTGSVYDEDEAHRAAELAGQVPGVRTVLNRLGYAMLESQLTATKQRFERGAADLHERGSTGGRVGTGRRRQGRETDPGRPDDRVAILSRALGTDRAVELAAGEIDKLPAGVEGHSTLPAAPSDRDAADHASHRRLGNVPATSPQALHPEARIHNVVPKGVQLSLEHAGLSRPRPRPREDRR